MTQTPEGATHHNEGHYYRKIGPTWMLFGSDHKWIETACHWGWLEDNAQPLVPAWTGEGLPPVGTVCQYQHVHHAGAWYDGKILYISGEYTIVFGSPVDEQHYYTRNLKFRPIRTPSQLAAEEREKAIEFMMQMTSSLGHSDVSKKILFGELYDKGLRFEVKP